MLRVCGASVTGSDLQILIRARYDAETVAIIAALIRDGVPPSEQNLESLQRCFRRLSKAVEVLGDHELSKATL